MTWIKTRKYFGQPSNIYESLSPFYYTLKFFGLASYSLNFKNGQMKTSWINYIMVLGSIALYLTFYKQLFELDSSKFTPGGKSIFVYGLVFFYQFQNITTLLIIIFNFLKRRNIEKFLKLLETFDDHCEKMGWKFKVNHEKNYWSSIFWIVISLILFICVTTYHNIWVPPVPPNLMDYINMICYGFLANALILSSLQFIFSVHSVASRFEVLDENTK